MFTFFPALNTCQLFEESLWLKNVDISDLGELQQLWLNFFQ